jgi:hypothetical protein
MSYYDEPAPAEPSNAELLQTIRLIEKNLRAIAAHVGLDPVMLQVEPADDYELNGEYGNPVIDRVPKNWSGEPLEGRHLSDLQPATLRALAKHHARLAEWHDQKGNVDNKGRPRSHWARRDAARALGWALRLEAQGHRGARRPAPAAPPPAPEPEPEQTDDDIPF